jgi:AcrR family transcriptional regulator
MQRPDETKRRNILKAAERMFASKPFHEVKLDELASKCRIGKGTIYTYFDSKEDLYVSLIREGLRDVVSSVQQQLAQSKRSSMEELRLVVGALVQFAAARPEMFQLMRTIGPKACGHPLRESRGEMVAVVRQVIERGVAGGEMADSNPELTAHYLVSSVRGGLLFGPGVGADAVTEHMLHVFGSGLARRKGR